MNSHNRGDEQALNVSYKGGGRGRGGQLHLEVVEEVEAGMDLTHFMEYYKCHKLGHFQYKCPIQEK